MYAVLALRLELGHFYQIGQNLKELIIKMWYLRRWQRCKALNDNIYDFEHFDRVTKIYK